MTVRWVVALPVLSFLVACAPVARRPSVADMDPLRSAVIDDVVRVLEEIDLPIGTVLVPTRPMAGRFDADLQASLRSAGYVVVSDKGAGKPFDASVISVAGAMHRVTVSIGKVTLSRLWVLDGTTAYTAGAWASRE
jgi:hypothetical protein